MPPDKFAVIITRTRSNAGWQYIYSKASNFKILLISGKHRGMTRSISIHSNCALQFMKSTDFSDNQQTNWFLRLVCCRFLSQCKKWSIPDLPYARAHISNAIQDNNHIITFGYYRTNIWYRSSSWCIYRKIIYSQYSEGSKHPEQNIVDFFEDLRTISRFFTHFTHIAEPEFNRNEFYF